VGQLNYQNYMIEGCVGRRLIVINSSRSMDWHVKRFHADLCEHGAEYCGLVLAIAITMTEYLAGRMRTVAANTDFNGVVAHVALGKKCQGTYALEEWQTRG